MVAINTKIKNGSYPPGLLNHSPNVSHTQPLSIPGIITPKFMIPEANA